MADNDTRAIFETLAAASQGQLALSNLAETLESLNAFNGQGRANAIARYSQAIVDALPKIFISKSGLSTANEQLQQKVNNHSLLLQTLSDGGIMMRLHAETLKCLFEDGQKTKALLEINNLDAQCRADSDNSTPLATVVKQAGEQCSQHILIGGEKTDDEVYFYSVPTTTVIAFFTETFNQLTNDDDLNMQTISQLVQGLQVALDAAQEQRSYQQQYYSSTFVTALGGGSNTGDPEWTASTPVCEALEAAAGALITMMSSTSTADNYSVINMLFDVSERLLNAYAAAIAAALPSSSRKTELFTAYGRVRDMCITPLLNEAIRLCRQGDTDPGEEYAQRVESLAESHNGYRQLFDICDALADSQRLQNHMVHLKGDELTESMTVYVFNRLLEEDRCSEILTLDAEFNRALGVWLRDMYSIKKSGEVGERLLNLMWMHSVREGQFQGASESLQVLASKSSGDEDGDYYNALKKLSEYACTPKWPFTV